MNEKHEADKGTDKGANTYYADYQPDQNCADGCDHYESSIHIEIVIKTTTVSAAGVVRAGVRIVTSCATVATTQIHTAGVATPCMRAILAGV